MSKYKIIQNSNKTISLPYSNGKVEVYQIEALINIPHLGVKIGDVGGWVEDESNLSQEGDCWIFKEGVVARESHIAGNAQVKGKSFLYNKSRLFDDASVENSTMDNSFMAQGCKAISSGLQNACFYEGVTLSSAITINVTAIHSIFKSSRVHAQKSCLVFWNENKKQPNLFEDTEFAYTSKRKANVRQRISVTGCRLIDIKSFKINSPLRMEFVETNKSFHLQTMKNLKSEANELKGLSKKEPLNLSERTNLSLRDSTITLSGYLLGSLVVIESKINTFGQLRNHQNGTLMLINVTMKEVSTIQKVSARDRTIEDMVLDGDSEYFI